MRVRVTKDADIDDDVATKILQEFIDWLDERGLLRDIHRADETRTLQYNSDVVSIYMEEKAIG